MANCGKLQIVYSEEVLNRLVLRLAIQDHNGPLVVFYCTPYSFSAVWSRNSDRINGTPYRLYYILVPYDKPHILT